MDRTQHPSNNAVLGAPKDWDQSDLACGALPITRTEVQGFPVVVSYWRPTADELAHLNAGACVQLSIIGTTMPPVSVAVDGM